MARKTAKKPTPHKSYVSNPAAGRTAIAKRKTAVTKANPTMRKRTTAAAVKANPHRRRRRHYKRNPSELMSGIMFAVGGAIALNGFNLIARALFPNLGTPITIGAKAAAGWAAEAFLGKYLGSYARVVKYALWLSAANDAWIEWVNPHLPAYLGGPSAATVVQTQPIQNLTNGQLGTRFHLADGSFVDGFTHGTEYAS